MKRNPSAFLKEEYEKLVKNDFDWKLRILQSAPVYAPVVVYYLAKVTDTYVKFNLPIYACENGGYLKYVYGVELGSHCDGGSGFQLNDELLVKASVLLDKEKYYIARFYKDGYEASTDTLQFDYSISAIKKRTSSQPNRFVLHQNYPNPFNPSTTIRYHLGTSGKVKMAVYNCLGRELNILVDRYQAAGDHSVQFQSGHLSSGVYFYSIETNNLKMVKKMLLLR